MKAILINPSVYRDKRDAYAIAVNEALRLFMEDVKFTPKFEATPEQLKLFRGTAYSGDNDAMKKTILARIATRDTSVPNPTEEQIEETHRLLRLVMEAIGEKHPDFPLMQKLDQAVTGREDNGSAEAPPAEMTPSGNMGTTQDDMRGGDVRGREDRHRRGTTEDDMKGGDTMPPPPPVIYPERDIRTPVTPKQSWTAAAVDYLVKTEKFSPKAYPDPGGKDSRWSVGYGNQFHPGQKRPVRPGDTVAPARAREYMADAMSYNVDKLRSSVGDKRWEGLTGGQKLALTSWAYNVGETNVRGSTLAKRMRNGEPAADVIRQELPRWHDAGKLKDRRAEELSFAESGAFE